MTDCPQCKYNRDRAARWRAEAYKQAGHDVIELPWVGLTDEDYFAVLEKLQNLYHRPPIAIFAKAIEQTLKEKNT